MDQNNNMVYHARNASDGTCEESPLFPSSFIAFYSTLSGDYILHIYELLIGVNQHMVPTVKP